MQQKAKALLESLAIFTLVVLLARAILAVSCLQGETQEILRRYLSYAPVLTIPLLLLTAMRRNLVDYGFSFRQLDWQLKIAAVSIPPMLMVSLVLSLVGWADWEQSMLVAVAEVGALCVIVWLVKRQPGPEIVLMLGLILIPRAGLPTPAPALDIPSIILRVVYSLIFVALGEEVLFRGHIQSRLSKAFGHPYQFGGVNWGWGIVITSLLFGLWHVLNPWNPFLERWELAWPWGLWTFFCGLILGTIREKTGGVWAPAILHAVINL